MRNSFPTGATTEAVNNLILYTNQNKELSAKRDEMYDKAHARGSPTMFSYFASLYRLARDQYKKEYKSSYYFTIDQEYEYCKLHVSYLSLKIKS